MMSMKLFITNIFVCIALALGAQDSTYVCFAEKVEMIPMNELNTESIEFSPIYYQNGLVFVVARERNRLFDPKTGLAYFDLMYADLAPNGSAGRPSNFSSNITTQFHEGPCSFTADGNEIYFTRSNVVGGQGVNDDKNQVQLKIYHGVRGPNDWESIAEFPFSSDEYSTAHPAISPDGNYLVFASNMPGGYGGMDLYLSERKDGKWQEPQNLGYVINSQGDDAFPFWHEHNYLFFASDGHRGLGKRDIFVTHLNKENKFTGIQHLDYPINSSKDDVGFIVSSDGKSGYMASDRKPTAGKMDLYQWTLPLPIFCDPSLYAPVFVSKELLVTSESGEPVSSAYAWLIPMDADGPSVHRDHFNTELVPQQGREGEFYLRWGVTDTLSINTADATSGNDGRVQLNVDEKAMYAIVVQHQDYKPYVTAVSAKELPTYIRLVKLPEVATTCYNTQFTVYNAEGSIRLNGAKVTITGPCLRKGEDLYTNTDGSTKTCLPKTCQLKAEVQQEGYAPHSFLFTPSEDDEHWTVYLKSSDKLTGPTAPIATGTVIVLDNIYYDFNKSEIRKSDAGELKALADVLKQYPDLSIELTSHTDTRGTAEYNMELSRRRSESSKAYLVLLGIRADRIVTKAAGESMPRNRCVDDVPCSEEEHQYNRRTEVKINNPAEGMEVRYKAKG